MENAITLEDISNFIPKLIDSVSSFLSTGVMFYIMCMLMFAIVMKILLSFLRR